MAIDTRLLQASWRSWYASDLQRVGPGWLQLVWTLVFCLAIAAAFTVLGFALFARGEGAWRNLPGWAHWYGINLVVALCIGFTTHALFDIAGRLIGAQRLRRFSRPQRGLFFSGVPLLGVLIGWPLGGAIVDQEGPGWFRLADANTIAGSVLLSIVISLVIYSIFAAKSQQIEAEKRAAEAQLRLLQGQIEPHFLFNTLANVLALIDDDAPKAKRMLESFTDYLRSSLVSLRGEQATLGGEIELVQAYLSLLKTRMEDRLQFSIAVDPALRDTRLPALALQPLVENAIHHGLEPKLEGGRVRVTARATGDELVLEVLDDGLGPQANARPRKGAGMAIANLRQRLAALYGNAAALTIEAATPGTRATLRLPLERNA